MIILSVNNISFNYDTITYFKGIRNISFRLNKGEVLGFVGKSGSGKTTLLKCIFGLEEVKNGEIFIGDKKLLGPSYNLIPGHEQMRLVSQDFYVLDNHTVEENVFDKLIGLTNDAKQKRTNKILKLLELTFLKNTRAKYLSSGQKQRVSIARALAKIPEILLLDEPFSNLDKLLTEKLFSFVVKEVKQHHTSVILITHLPEEALKYADRLAVIENGKISQIGKKWEVYYKPKSSRLAGLLGYYNILRVEDLSGNSKLNFKSKMFFRPDKIKLSLSKSNYDIKLNVINCSFNGKCFEILAETINSHAIIIYLNTMLDLDKEYEFNLEV